jgi:hypothetical protein
MATNANELQQDDFVDPQDEDLEGEGKFTLPQDDSAEEVLTRYEEFVRMGVNGLIEQGAKYAANYSRSLSTLEALAEVCVALMTKYPAPVHTDTNKAKPTGYIAAKDKDKKIKDWGGRSEQYSKSIQKIYDKAGVGNNESTIRTNLKYWRQNLVKKVAPTEDLVALGMKTAKRGAGGATNQTQKSTGASKATTTGQPTDNPIKFIETVGPQIIQLEANIKKGAIKTKAEREKMITRLKPNIEAMIRIWKLLHKIDFIEEEMTIGAYGFRQTMSAKEASEKEASSAKDGQK